VKDPRACVTAAIFWAKTRMGWKETAVTEVMGKDGGPIETREVVIIPENLKDLSDDQLARLYREVADSAQANR
jgi:hypothetical protein